MSRKWSDDAALVSSLTDNLFEALPLFPQKLLKIEEVVRAQNMPYSNIRILILLAKGDMSISQLSEQLGIAKPNITPLVDHLHAQGLVERIRNSKDRRIVHVHLLPAGAEKIAALRESVMEQVMAWPGNLSKSEVKELNNAMASINRISALMD